MSKDCFPLFNWISTENSLLYLDPFFNLSFFVCLFVWFFFFALWFLSCKERKNPELNVLEIASVELFSFNCVFFSFVGMFRGGKGLRRKTSIGSQDNGILFLVG